jgi:CheY-like chemotaxis protein
MIKDNLFIILYFLTFLVYSHFFMNKCFNNVLLVDDDAVSNFINELTLQEMNFSNFIHVSENGKEALHYLTSALVESEKHPDLIFLDINMPVMDGFQFLEEFEKLPLKVRKSIRVIMLTSSNATLDISKAKRYNINGYIVKPLCKSKLEEVFNKS